MTCLAFFYEYWAGTLRECRIEGWVVVDRRGFLAVRHTDRHCARASASVLLQKLSNDWVYLKTAAPMHCIYSEPKPHSNLACLPGQKTHLTQRITWAIVIPIPQFVDPFHKPSRRKGIAMQSKPIRLLAVLALFSLLVGACVPVALPAAGGQAAAVAVEKTKISLWYKTRGAGC